MDRRKTSAKNKLYDEKVLAPFSLHNMRGHLDLLWSTKKCINTSGKKERKSQATEFTKRNVINFT